MWYIISFIGGAIIGLLPILFGFGKHQRIEKGKEPILGKFRGYL